MIFSSSPNRVMSSTTKKTLELLRKIGKDPKGLAFRTQIIKLKNKNANINALYKKFVVGNNSAPNSNFNKQLRNFLTPRAITRRNALRLVAGKAGPPAPRGVSRIKALLGVMGPTTASRMINQKNINYGNNLKKLFGEPAPSKPGPNVKTNFGPEISFVVMNLITQQLMKAKTVPAAKKIIATTSPSVLTNSILKMITSKLAIPPAIPKSMDKKILTNTIFTILNAGLKVPPSFKAEAASRLGFPKGFQVPPISFPKGFTVPPINLKGPLKKMFTVNKYAGISLRNGPMWNKLGLRTRNERIAWINANLRRRFPGMPPPALGVPVPGYQGTPFSTATVLQPNAPTRNENYGGNLQKLFNVPNTYYNKKKNVKQTGTGTGPNVKQTGTGTGPNVKQTGTGTGPNVKQTGTGTGPNVKQTGTGTGPNVKQTGTGTGPNVKQTVTSTGPNVKQSGTGGGGVTSTITFSPTITIGLRNLEGATRQAQNNPNKLANLMKLVANLKSKLPNNSETKKTLAELYGNGKKLPDPANVKKALVRSMNNMRYTELLALRKTSKNKPEINRHLREAVSDEIRAIQRGSSSERGWRLGELFRSLPSDFSGRERVERAMKDEIRRASRQRDPVEARRHLSNLYSNFRLGRSAPKSLLREFKIQNSRATSNWKEESRRYGGRSRMFESPVRGGGLRQTSYTPSAGVLRQAPYNRGGGGFSRVGALNTLRQTPLGSLPSLSFKQSEPNPLPVNQQNAINRAGGVNTALQTIASVPGGAPVIAKAAANLNEMGGNVQKAVEIRGANPVALVAVSKLGGAKNAAYALEGLNTLSRKTPARKTKGRKKKATGLRLQELNKVIRSVKKRRLMSIVSKNVTKVPVNMDEARLKKYYQKVIKANILRAPFSKIVRNAAKKNK